MVESHHRHGVTQRSVWFPENGQLKDQGIGIQQLTSVSSSHQAANGAQYRTTTGAILQGCNNQAVSRAPAFAAKVACGTSAPPKVDLGGGEAV